MKCFHSLQTGKHIQSRQAGPENDEQQASCFHSLPTGKHIQREKVTPAGDGHGGCPYDVSIPFQRESISKEVLAVISVSKARKCFHSLPTGKHIQRDPILSPVGPWLRTPKTKRELRGAIFKRNLSPKIPQTHVCIDPNAIF